MKTVRPYFVVHPAPAATNWNSRPANRSRFRCAYLTGRLLARIDLRQTGAMGLEETEEEEILRLNLAAVSAAPDTWRSRAVTAGGFLGAAAAVSLWGVTGSDGPQAPLPTGVTVGVAVAYAVAIILFLTASVFPTPRPNHDRSLPVGDQLERFSRRETRPIRCLVMWGAGVGAIALLGTSIAATLAVRDVPESVRAYIGDEEYRTAAEALCPGLPQVFHAKVSDESPGMIQLEIEGDWCSVGDTLTMPSSAIVRIGSS